MVSYQTLAWRSDEKMVLQQCLYDKENERFWLSIQDFLVNFSDFLYYLIAVNI